MDSLKELLMPSRILIITQHFPPENSGNASRIYDLSRNLVSLGSEVIVISPFPNFPQGRFKKTYKRYTYREIDGIHHYSIFAWQPTYINPSFVSRISYYLTFPIHAIWWALLKRKEYDVIITSSPPIFSGIPGYIIKKITRKKWLFDVRDLWIDASVELGFLKKKSFFEKISRWYERICYHNCDLITVTTEEIRRRIADTYNISIDKLRILSNGVDTKVFKPSTVKKNRIIYAGNIGHAQDLEKFILAVKKVNEKFSLEFYLVGDGDIKNDLLELVKKENLENIVFFTGSLEREKIPGLIAESLIGVAPLKNLQSLNYAIPTKVYEYMSCGIPFIATGRGEIEDLAKSCKAGAIADNSIESIYKVMTGLLENKKLIDEMGDKGRDFAEKYYNRKKIAEHLLYNIDHVVSNG
jgi:colanic acid biosynthesis glycosyl transferase WcaI